MADYDPTPLLSNPIACMTSWLGGILRSPTPSYQPAPPPPPPPPPVPTVARVRGIVTERAAITAADGEYCGAHGSTGGPGTQAELCQLRCAGRAQPR